MAEEHKSSDVLTMLMDHQGIIHKLSFMYSNSKEEYQDLQQEIHYQLVNSYKSFAGKSKLSTWVYKVALFTSMAHLRKRPKATSSLDYLTEFQVEEEPNEAWNTVLDAIKNLPDMDKSIILLYLEDRSYKEMAEILGLSESNIGVKLNRIKNKLRKQLKQL